MLVDFTFTNYGAFRDKTHFSMVAASLGTDEEEMLIEVADHRMKLLPLTAIYGGNASGKSTFVNALSCLKSLVLTGKIRILPFVLDDNSLNRPTSFAISILISNELWKYELSVSRSYVEKEYLSKIVNGRTTFIFKSEPCNKKFSASQKIFKNRDARTFAVRLGRSFSSSETVLAKIAMMDIPGLSNLAKIVYDWFKNTLNIISSDRDPSGLPYGIVMQPDAYVAALQFADTGISGIDREEIPIKQLNISDDTLSKFLQSTGTHMFNPKDRSVHIVKNGNEVKAYRMVTTHTSVDGKKIVSFPFAVESDGTRQFACLLPLILNHSSVEKVYVIDELDRSLHTKLCRYFLMRYLELVRDGVRQQLIFTTHDVTLMDDNLLRKDEIWATERDKSNVSHLSSFLDYGEIKNDNNIRQSYLDGRLGGMPDIDILH